MKSITINGSKRESVGKVATKALRCYHQCQASMVVQNIVFTQKGPDNDSMVVVAFEI